MAHSRHSRALRVLLTGLLTLLATATTTPVGADPAAPSQRRTELLARRASSNDGVVRFSSADWEQFAVTPGRDYHLVFFVNAEYLADNANMQLPALRKEFGVMAQSYKQPAQSSVFLAELLYERSKSVLTRLNVKSLPLIFHWGPESVAREGRSIKLPKASKCGPGISTYPFPAEALAACVAKKTGVAGARIERPTLAQHPLFPAMVLFGIVVGGKAAWMVYSSRVLHVTGLYGLGALGVYWFATSGGMYNIIRGIPFASRDRQGRPVYWTQGRQGQLGAEGFIMGSSYILFSTTLASLTYVVPRIRHSVARAAASVVLVAAAAFMAHRILDAYHSKSGMRMRSFLPFNL